MKYSDRFFKFPVKMYNGLDFRKIETKIDKMIQEELPIDIQKPKCVGAFEYCLPEQIVHISPSLDFFEPIDVTIEHGLNRCEITISNGRTFYCIWSPEKFLAKLDAFIEKQEEQEKISMVEHAEEIAKILESKLEEIKQKYSNNNLNINFTEDGTFTITKIEGDTRNPETQSRDTEV